MSPPPPLVLLPGTMCDARLFAPQAARFGGEREIITPQINGHPGGIPAAAAELFAALPPRFALAGLSLGGIVALEMLRQDLQRAEAARRISHCALFNTNDGADTAAGQEKREADFAAAQKEGLENFIRREMIPRYLHKDNLPRADLANTIAAMAADAGMEKWRAQLDLLPARKNARPVLAAAAKTKTPLCIACGEDDRICPPALHTEMAAAAGVTAEIYPAAAHLSTIEAPDQVNKSLARLLARPRFA